MDMDRERVINGIQECDLNGGLIGNCPYKGILALLKEQPQIIRCKDCKYGEPTRNVYGDERISCSNTHGYVDSLCFTMPPDWFCADAERK